MEEKKFEFRGRPVEIERTAATMSELKRSPNLGPKLGATIAPDTGDVTEADLLHLWDAAVSRRVWAVLERRRIERPDYGLGDLRDDVIAARKRP